jgi:hypothetical protein
MAHTMTKSGREVIVDDDRAYETPVQSVQTAHRQNVAARIIWFIASVILTLLAFRFVLSLLGANPSNGFASFIYDTSHPFVSPFFSLFSYDDALAGKSKFEVYTLVAMAVYTVVAAGLARLVTITRD